MTPPQGLGSARAAVGEGRTVRQQGGGERAKKEREGGEREAGGVVDTATSRLDPSHLMMGTLGFFGEHTWVRGEETVATNQAGEWEGGERREKGERKRKGKKVKEEETKMKKWKRREQERRKKKEREKKKKKKRKKKKRKRKKRRKRRMQRDHMGRQRP